MHLISNDNPARYLTSVAKDRLPVFRTAAIKEIVCNALNEARESGEFAIYAYVVMPEHLHSITDSSRKPSEILRYINGIVSRRVIDYLREKDFRSSLEKLRHEIKPQNYRYSLWQHHNNSLSLTSESFFMQKVNYIHQNPVRAGLVETAVDYRWSSARYWKGCTLENEPLRVDLDKLIWRKSKG
jgi:REP element-mobilizing transposase RayT